VLIRCNDFNKINEPVTYVANQYHWKQVFVFISIQNESIELACDQIIMNEKSVRILLQKFRGEEINKLKFENCDYLIDISIYDDTTYTANYLVKYEILTPKGDTIQTGEQFTDNYSVQIKGLSALVPDYTYWQAVINSQKYIYTIPSNPYIIQNGQN
jgi:hypothetical protein